MSAQTAGALYQAALRHELRELGLVWAVRDNGLAELAEVPHRVLRAFSRRRVEIEQAMAERGTSSRAAAETATLVTRKARITASTRSRSPPSGTPGPRRSGSMPGRGPGC